MRIALLNIESVASADAIRALLTRRRDMIALVAVSSAGSGGWPRLVRRAHRHLRQSGWRFLSYLAVNHVIGPRLPGLSVHAVCRELSIPAVACPDVNAADFRERLAAARIDLIVSFYFDQIIDEATIRCAAFGAINVHPAPLPAYRGPSPIVHRACDGLSDDAVTIHRIDDRSIDRGPILAQRPVASGPGASVLAREQTALLAGADALDRLLDGFADAPPGHPQGRGSYQGFPARAVVERARSNGTPLWRVADLRARPSYPTEPENMSG